MNDPVEVGIISILSRVHSFCLLSATKWSVQSGYSFKVSPTVSQLHANIHLVQRVQNPTRGGGAMNSI